MMLLHADAKERASQRPRAVGLLDPSREALAVRGGHRIARWLRAISKRGPLVGPDIIVEHGGPSAAVAQMIAPTFV